MRSVAVLVFLAAFLAAAIASRFISVLFYWWLAIFRPQDWIYIDISALRVSLVAGVLVVAGCLLTGRYPRVSMPLGWLVLVFLALEAVATYTNGCGPEGWRWLDHLARLFLILYFTDRLVTTPRRFLALLAVVGGSLGFYSAKAGFFAVLAGGAVQYGVDNLEGSFSGSNAFALGTSVIVFYLLAVALNLRALAGDLGLDEQGAQRPWVKWLRRAIFVAVACSVFNVASLYSRGALLGCLASMFMFFAIRPRGFWRVMAVVPLMLIAVAVVPLPDGIEERVSSAFKDSDELDTSAASRPHFWAVAAAMAKVYPYGIGAKCYALYYDAFDPSQGQYGHRRSVHGAHAQVLAETGFPGLGVWILMLGSSLFILWRVRHRARDPSLTPAQAHFLESSAACMACSIVAFVLGGTFYETAHMEVIWLSVVLTGTLSRLSRDMVLGKEHSIVGPTTPAPGTKRSGDVSGPAASNSPAASTGLPPNIYRDRSERRS